MMSKEDSIVFLHPSTVKAERLWANKNSELEIARENKRVAQAEVDRLEREIAPLQVNYSLFLEIDGTTFDARRMKVDAQIEARRFIISSVPG